MKKKDLIIIACAALLALGLFALDRLGVFQPSAPRKAQQAPEGLKISLSPLHGREGAEALLLTPMQPGMQRVPAEGYLRITADKVVYEPIPLTQDRRIAINQAGGQQNIALIQRGTVHMDSANCPTQDCIHQGSMSLETRELRLMQGSIVCLPHKLVLELLDEQQARAYYGEGK